MKKDYDISEYNKKRDFEKTAEPKGEKHKASRSPIFVIQEHDARSHHFDFRIEVDGVLKSWAVPKGPSTDTRVKRLAIRTEDHPMDYADFEGIIPEGEYGAGTVIVWDKGTYQNVTQKDGKPVEISDAIEHGHYVIELNGTKLKGGFAMTRFKKDENEHWLLVKKEDAQADAKRDPAENEPHSVKSGKTISEIRKDAGVDR